MKRIFLFSFFMLVFQALYSADISDIITRQFFLPYEGITDESFKLEVIYNGITSEPLPKLKFLEKLLQF